MDEASLRQALQAISGKDLALRKAWYSPVAEAYQATRPSYPSDLVGRAVSAAKLSSSSRILELGCGPGTATVSFVALGCAMVCLEPNSDFCAMVRQNCKAYLSVQVINQSFEEWDLEPEAFDAVLAASSMHWIPAEIGYAKASHVLKKDGFLLRCGTKNRSPSRPCRRQRHARPGLAHHHADRLAAHGLADACLRCG
jgi:SAM-dependent methyltransferase